MKIYITGDENSYSYKMEKNSITIGRSELNDFHVPDQELSRTHCQLIMEEDQIFIMDMASKNGVYVDGKRIPPHQKYPVALTSVIVLAKRLNLTFMRRPGQTILSLTGQMEVEEIPPRAGEIKIRRK